MKKFKRILVGLVILVACFLPAASIGASAQTITISVGQTKNLKIPGNKKKAKWKTSNKKIVKVNKKGKIKGIKVGKCKITATVGKKRYSCMVKVKKKKAVQSTQNTEKPHTSLPQNNLSIWQSNALDKAKSYLSFSSFSREGLIAQLQYEGFSYGDSVYAVDNCGANWYEQALKKAKSYLDYSAFSKEGLIGQLEYEKFTPEQAQYGVAYCGADWYEQAVKKARQYLEYSSFSKSALIAQLEYEKFTHEEAVYGVEYWS